MHRLPVRRRQSCALHRDRARPVAAVARAERATASCPAASVPAAWPDKLTLSWRQPVGEGYSSPVVDDGRVFVHSRSEPDEVVSAFDLESGEPIWSARYPSSFTKNQYATHDGEGPVLDAARRRRPALHARGQRRAVVVRRRDGHVEVA